MSQCAAMAIALALLGGLAASVGASDRAGVSFDGEPKVERTGAGVRISFAAAAETDAAVWIADASGRVVRHLAAGMLGGSAPAPFARDRLSQQLTWDGTDDAGRLVDPAGCSVHVALGSRFAFDRIYLDSRQTVGTAASMAVDGEGRLHILQVRGSSFYGGVQLTVHDRDGKYLRTMIPYPPDLPEDKVAGFGRIRRADGSFMPAIYDVLALGIQPFVSAMDERQTMTFLADGRLLLSSGSGCATNHGPAQHLLALMPDGSCPPDGFVKTGFSVPRGYLGGTAGSLGASPGHLAADPTGKWIYFSGVEAMGKVRHGVYRFLLSAERLSERAFLGDADTPGDDDAHFNRPQGIAVDAKGDIYVADYGNNRVMGFDPGGRLLGKLAVPSPGQIAVHPTRGTLYVLSWVEAAKNAPASAYVRQLRRFDSLSAAAPSSVIDLPRSRNPRYDMPVMALDATGERPRVWVSGDMGKYLIAYADTAAGLTAGPNVAHNSQAEELTGVAADPRGGRLLLKTIPYYGLGEFDLASGALARFPLKHAYSPAFDAAGNLYVDQSVYKFDDGAMGGYVVRLDPKDKPLAFPGGDANRTPRYLNAIVGNHFNPWGSMCVSPDGHVYVLHGGPNDVKTDEVIDRFGLDGKLERAGVVRGLPPSAQAVGVDRDGNLYVGMNLHDPAEPLPPPFAGQAPAAWWWQKSNTPGPPWNGGYTNAYLFAGGVIVKFGPEGGEVSWKKPLAGPGVIRGHRAGDPARGLDLYIRGARWIHRGFSPVMPGKDIVSTDAACVCHGARFAVDGFGRLLVPDALRFSVALLDGAGNEIGRFGRYGNQDATGEAGSPDVPLYCPLAVDAAGPWIYVADMGNRRVVRVRQEYGAERQCVIR